MYSFGIIPTEWLRYLCLETETLHWFQDQRMSEQIKARRTLSITNYGEYIRTCHEWQAINHYDEWPEGLGLKMTGIECFIASQLLLELNNSIPCGTPRC